ncbi:unnamed protein product, partial [Nesidiocoris tenuis]
MRGNIPNRFVYMLNRMRPSGRRYIAALARHFFQFPQNLTNSDQSKLQKQKKKKIA